MPERRGRRAGLVAAALLVAGLAGGCAAPPEAVRVEITVRYSSFEPSRVTVPRGVPVTFVLVNADPIDHEWLIGDAGFHERHRTGTEAEHGSRPNEIGIGAFQTVETTLTWDEPGDVDFICHLPGHEAYGMVGRVTVL